MSKPPKLPLTMRDWPSHAKQAVSIVHEMLAYIGQLEIKLTDQSGLETTIERQTRAINAHAAQIADRDRAVKHANDLLHLERLENVRCRREISALKQRIMKEVTDDPAQLSRHPLRR